MAFGDPANAGANHGQRDAGTVGVTTDTSTPAFATTAGNTLVVGVRGGAASGAISVNVSENSGSSFTAATLADVQHTVTSVGTMALFYFPNLAGAANGSVRVQVNLASSATLRYEWCEYTGAFSFDAATEGESGATPSNAFDSGALTTSATRTLIGFLVGARNTSSTDPPSPGTTNSLTWTVRDHLTDGNTKITCALFDFNAGGQAAGTYHCLGTMASALTDEWGCEIYSFSQAAAAGGITYVPPRVLPEPVPQYHQWAQRTAVVDQSTAANPLPSPLDVWAQQSPHMQAAYFVDRRQAGQQRIYIDPNQFPSAAFDPTQAGLGAAYKQPNTVMPWSPWYAQRDLRDANTVGTPANPLPSPLDVWAADPPHRAWRRDPYWTPPGAPGKDPNLLVAAAVFNPTLAGLSRTYMPQPWPDPDRTEWEQRPYISDPAFYPLDGTGIQAQPLWWSADVFPEQLLAQRPYISVPGLLATALLEDVLLFAGAPKTPWRRDPYWIPGRPYAFDPNELVAPGQTDPTLAGIAAQYKVLPIPPPWIPWYAQRDLRDANTVATPANPLPSPLDTAWQAGGRYWHLYNDWQPRPSGPVQARPYAYDPSELVPPGQLDPTLAGLLAFAYYQPGYITDRRQVPQQRAYISDPTLLTTALLEDVVLFAGAPKTPWRRDPYWIAARPYAFDPNELLAPGQFDPTLGGGLFWSYLTAAYNVDRRNVPQQRPYISPPDLLATALLEDVLLGGYDDRRRHYDQAATHYDRRQTVPQRRLVSDPSMLLTALLEDALLVAGAPRIPWRRDPYWIRRPGFPAILIPPVPFDPTLAGIDWTRVNAIFHLRPDSAAYWYRPLNSDAAMIALMFSIGALTAGSAPQASLTAGSAPQNTDT